jgi:hypothetical protein
MKLFVNVILVVIFVVVMSRGVQTRATRLRLVNREARK